VKARSVVLAILLSTALVGCGSTVRQTVASSQNGTTSSTGDAIDGAGAARAPGVGGPNGVGANASTTIVGGTDAGGGNSRADVSAPGAPSGSVTGVTATQIRVGYGTQKDADQAAGTFGLNAVFGDQEGQARAVVNDINANGGVLGRKLVLVFHDDRTANDLRDPDTTATSECTDWTQDKKVFAGINIVGARNRDSMFGCMKKAHTPLLVSDLVGHSLHQLQTYAPYLYMPGVATIERWAPVWIKRLNARGYFRGWNTTLGASGTAPVKVGVPYQDSPEGHRYFSIVSRALASVGRKADDSFAFSKDDSTALQQIPAIILQFKSHNVTHVLLPESAYLVTPVAERQSYRPRYGMTTLDGLSSLTVTTSPREQLAGTLAVGWLPVSDVDAAHDPGDVGPNETRCRRVMTKAGQDTSNRLTFTTELIVCELFYFLASALNHAGTISASALQSGAAALGDRFPSAFTFIERYGPQRFDGAGAVRDVGFNSGCSCFVFLDRVNRALPS